jgi:hypothetical protein
MRSANRPNPRLTPTSSSGFARTNAKSLSIPSSWENFDLESCFCQKENAALSLNDGLNRVSNASNVCHGTGNRLAMGGAPGQTSDFRAGYADQRQLDRSNCARAWIDYRDA